MQDLVNTGSERKSSAGSKRVRFHLPESIAKSSEYAGLSESAKLCLHVALEKASQFSTMLANGSVRLSLGQAIVDYRYLARQAQTTNLGLLAALKELRLADLLSWQHHSKAKPESFILSLHNPSRFTTK